MKNRLRLCALEDRLAPAIATWDGGGVDNHWTTAANWTGDVAPSPGDDLVFPSGAAQLANVNDFAAGTAFQSLIINDGGYQISGNAVQVNTGVSANIPQAGVAKLNLSIGGPGGVSNNSSGTLVLGGDNTFTGQSVVHFGSIRVESDHALGTTDGDTI